jgi:hypothetical protein
VQLDGHVDELRGSFPRLLLLPCHLPSSLHRRASRPQTWNPNDPPTLTLSGPVVIPRHGDGEELRPAAEWWRAPAPYFPGPGTWRDEGAGGGTAKGLVAAEAASHDSIVAASEWRTSNGATPCSQIFAHVWEGILR